jgi:DNA-directed RNA polymerase specialized sigma24 family protein
VWETRLRRLEGCMAQLPDEQLSLVEGYYFRRDGIETLAIETGRSVAATYKMLQRIRHSLQRCIESTANPEGATS